MKYLRVYNKSAVKRLNLRVCLQKIRMDLNLKGFEWILMDLNLLETGNIVDSYCNLYIEQLMMKPQTILGLTYPSIACMCTSTGLGLHVGGGVFCFFLFFFFFYK